MSGPEVEATMLAESGTKAISLFVGEFAVLVSPRGEKLLQLTNSIQAFRINLTLRSRCERLDAYELTLGQGDLAIEDNDTVFHVPRDRCRR